jgi:WD40 repeat protein
MIVASPDFATANILAVTRKVSNGYALSFKDLFGGYNEQPLTVSRTPIERVKFHPSAQYVAFCTQEGDLEVWTTRGVPRPHWRLDATATGYKHINDFAFCYPAGKRLAVALEGQESISVWDIYDDHPLPQPMPERKALSHRNWAPDEEPLQVVATVTEHSGRALVACATRHRRIYLWHLGSSTPETPESDVIQVDAVPVALALSANAKKLAWGTGRGDVHVIQTDRLDSGRETRSVATASVSLLAFSPHLGDCLLVAGATNGQLKVWSYETWNELIPPSDVALGKAGSRFSADGGHMLTSNLDAGIIELWRVKRST